MSGRTSKYDTDRRDMLHRVPSSSRTVLDVGCDTGRFGALLGSQPLREVRVFGVEPAEHGSAQLDGYEQVWRGTFPEAVPEGRRFDCIVMNDVLEHMVDPWSALEKARTMLEPGGTIVGSVPNVRHISVLHDLVVRGEFRYRSVGIMDIGHVRFFTASSIRTALVDAGLTVTDVHGINIPHRRRSFRLLARVAPRVAQAVLARQIAFAAVVG